MRVSDSERQRAIEELRRHCAAGRIDVDEYAVRIEKALAATTLEELDDLRADLPMLRIADPAAPNGRIWADRADAPSPKPAVSSGRTSPGRAGGIPSLKERVSASAVVVLSVIVVVTAVLIGLIAEWTWAAVLLAGWLVGVAQGRIQAQRSSRS